MKYIVQAVESRRPFVEEILAQVPEAIVHYDGTGDATQAFVDTLRLAGDEPHVHLEDDVVLCKGFVAKTKLVAGTYPGRVVSLFSFSRLWRASTQEMIPSTYGGAQGVYFPRGYGAMIADFMQRTGLDYWRYRGGGVDLNHGFDFAIRDFLIARRERYVIVWPSLVQHRVSVSAISPKRPKRRQSYNFIDDLRGR